MLTGLAIIIPFLQSRIDEDSDSSNEGPVSFYNNDSASWPIPLDKDDSNNDHFFAKPDAIAGTSQ